jgi:hypothetical protein
MKNLILKIMKATQNDLQKLEAALNENPVCQSGCDLRETELDNDGGGVKVKLWLNPRNQKCFNFGYFEYQDYYDWIQGKGKIIKGSTPEEQQKFWEVAVFEHEHDMSWAIGYYKKYFHLIDETYRTEIKKGLGYWTYPQSSLKIKKDNHAEIIGKVFGNVCRWYGDTTVEPTSSSHFRKRMHDELCGVKETLFAMGVGYYGACNSPEDPENLSWMADLCEYKATYLYFINNEIELPDFDFVYNYKEKY